MKIIFILLIIFSSISCFSQAGSLDETFGTAGKVYTDIDGECFAITLQPDDKILGGGHAQLGFTLIRYMPDGRLDSTFGDTGIVYISGGIFIGSTIRALTVLPDKSILASGSAHGVVVVKYKEDGSLDSSFGENGVSQPTSGAVRDMCVQADGKILLAGVQSLDIDDFAMLLLRLNADGSLDESFGNNGLIIDNVGYEFRCLALQQDGKIVAGGHNWPLGAGDRDQFSITRYEQNGDRDLSFGQGGRVLTDVSEGNDVPYDLKILSEGSIVATGISNENIGASKTHMAVVKYNSNGNLSKSFGENGIVNILFDDKSSFATGLLVQQDEKIIVTGYTLPGDAGDKGDYAMARLKSNGDFDSSFGVNGEVISNLDESEVSNASVLQPDEKIILAGETSTHVFLLARYLNDLAMPLHFTYFNASPTNNGGITLNWQTAQENNNNYFSIERSTSNANNFNELTRINSKGNSSQLQTYSCTDNTPLQGTNFYRLKQVDKDGKFSYSQVVSATVENGLTVVLYPNPVKDILHIKGLTAIMSYELSVMNEKGNTVASASINNTSVYNWNLQPLSKGVYYVNVSSSNHKTVILKFIKQ